MTGTVCVLCSKARRCVEQLFGIMKRQWLILDMATTEKKSRKVLDTWACAILHNLMVRYRQDLHLDATMDALRAKYGESVATVEDLEDQFRMLVAEAESELVAAERKAAAAAAAGEHLGHEGGVHVSESMDGKVVRDGIKDDLMRRRDHNLLPAYAGDMPPQIRDVLQRRPRQEVVY